MTPFSQLIAGMADADNECTVTVSEDWLQGRTLYGGLSAALCLEGAQRLIPALPPLQSAHFAFVGPAAGPLRIVPTVLRRGKSTVFASVDLIGEAGVATRATLCFGAPRPSAFQYRHLPAPDAPRPTACERFFPTGPAPKFAQHFDLRYANGNLPMSSSAEPDLLLWLKHIDDTASHSMVSLIALADAPPPPAMALFSSPAPISTMTWSVDVLAGLPADDDGWRLLRSTAETVGEGYSCQAMTVWDSAGMPLLAARQCVAVFA